MESSVSQQIKVGFFITIGILMIAISIVLLGQDNMFWQSTYKLQVSFKQVVGLSRGSVVSLAGVTVGRVDRISFKENSPLLIADLQIDREFSKRITQGAVASVRTLGALGDKYIYIEPGLPDSPPLAPNSLLESDMSEDLLDIIAKKGDKISAITDVIGELSLLLKTINKDGRSAALMENLVSASGNMNRMLMETRQALNDAKGNKPNENRLRNTLIHLESVLQKIDEGDGTLGALINDASLHQKLLTLLGEPPRKTYLKTLIRDTIKHQDKVK